MLEYVFFQDLPRKRFQEFLREQGLAWTLEANEMETLVVIDEAGVDDDLADRIESVYDELFALDQAIYDAGTPEPADRVAGPGVVVQLKDGRTVYADLPSELVSRVLTVISPAEFGTIVHAIASAVEDPDERRVGRGRREGETVG